MRGPKGSDYDCDFPMSGTFHEVVEPERFVFTAVAEDLDGGRCWSRTPSSRSRTWTANQAHRPCARGRARPVRAADAGGHAGRLERQPGEACRACAALALSSFRTWRAEAATRILAATIWARLLEPPQRGYRAGAGVLSVRHGRRTDLKPAR